MHWVWCQSTHQIANHMTEVTTTTRSTSLIDNMVGVVIIGSCSYKPKLEPRHIHEERWYTRSYACQPTQVQPIYFSERGLCEHIRLLFLSSYELDGQTKGAWNNNTWIWNMNTGMGTWIVGFPGPTSQNNSIILQQIINKQRYHATWQGVFANRIPQKNKIPGFAKNALVQPLYVLSS